MSNRNRKGVSDEMLPGHGAAVAEHEANGTMTVAASEPAKPLESKDVKFRRLRDMRMAKAVKALAQVRNLSSRQSYTYTGEEAAEIIDSLAKIVEEIRLAYAGSAVAASGWKSKVS